SSRRGWRPDVMQSGGNPWRCCYERAGLFLFTDWNLYLFVLSARAIAPLKSPSNKDVLLLLRIPHKKLSFRSVVESFFSNLK
ncbi:MAG: hypothetical protein PHF75_08655, partial [Gallionella sp.]|nr:hypothetical protein [Gallionella sp.]